MELQQSFAPINFFYSHLHNTIKAEFESLARWVQMLDAPGDNELLPNRLLELRERYRFLEQVYKYHSSVEDEVVYPALDAKVKNVTMAYSVEHQDEEMLFEQLAQLISAAISQAGADRTATIRELICKVEEIHRTLKKHLAKEEEQLLPLLLQHFSFAEQAGLVAQFLYCIPLAMVERVLAWLKPHIPLVEQESLLHHIRSVVPDDLLLELLTSWLQPQQQQQQQLDGNNNISTSAPSNSNNAAAGHDHQQEQQRGEAAGVQEQQQPGKMSRAPIKEIIHIHRTICAALEEFAGELRCLQQRPDVTASQLASLVERHRFLRSVCMFHTISEEEVMYPEVRRLADKAQRQEPAAAAAGVTAAASTACAPLAGSSSRDSTDGADVAYAVCAACELEHEEEVAALEELGRLLADVRAFARRGRKEVAQMLEQLSCCAENVLRGFTQHMAREEAEVLPLLEHHLCAMQQRTMVWRTLRAMPLRLLERVMPWVTASLSEEDKEELLNNIRLGAPEPDSALVELLARWADQGSKGQHAEGTRGLCSLTTHLSLPRGDSNDGSGLMHGSGNLGHADGNGVGGSSMQPEQHSSGAKHLLQGGGTADCRDSKRQRVSAADGITDGGLDHNNHSMQLPYNVPSSNTTHPCCCQNNTAAGQQAPASQRASGQVSNSNPPHHIVLLPPDQQQPAGGLQQQHTTSAPSYAPPPGSSSQSATFSQQAGQQGSQLQLQQHPQQQQQQGTQQQQQEPRRTSQFNPIDHIFQFHQALRQELRQLEADALNVEAAVLTHIAEQQQQQQPQQQPHQGHQQQQQQQLPLALLQAQQPQQPAGAEGALAGTHQQQPAELQRQDCSTSITSQHVSGAAHSMDEHSMHCASGAADAASTPTRAASPPLERCATPTVSAFSAVSGADACAAGMGAATTTTGAVLSSYANRLPRRVGAAVQALDGRFQFLWGIYRAHSRSEDEIVFPALESKQALRNVSHAYTLDHQQEEQLFLDLEQVIDALRRCDGGVKEAREAALAVRRMCAAVRASLETHIRSEEAELWPLFTEHFSHEEQQYLVGVIIGRTGAQVLQALLPWISDSFSLEEKELMMGSLRQATKNTMFDQWLEAVTHQTSSATAATVASAAAAPSNASSSSAVTTTGMVSMGSGQQQQAHRLGSGAHAAAEDSPLPDPELARFLPVPVQGDGSSCSTANGTVIASDAPVAADGRSTDASNDAAQHMAMQGTAASSAAGAGAGEAGADAAAAAAEPAAAAAPAANGGAQQKVESSTFRPGWEDIFRMNQKQLEAAVMRVSADPHLEPGRKAYLIQNIMVSKYIVAQQKRMQKEQDQQQGGGAPAAQCAAAQGPSLHGAAAAQGCATPDSTQGGDASGAKVVVRRTYHDPAHGVLGCKHYRRRAQLVAPCCNRVFTCRLCHDEAVSHRMDRYAVTDMVCMECGTQQPVAGSCSSCGTKLARYYCSICHLFDDEPGRDIYHCPFCNVCRRGRGLGIDFFHCMQCNACMNLSLFKSHMCRERAMESNCPVCSEYLFDSAEPIKELPCGHLLHSRCFAEYTRYHYTCPLCSKSVGDMSVYFQMLDSLLASERLPPEYAGRMQQVLCNDCGKSGFARFHFAYHACPHCRSYNTRLM